MENKVLFNFDPEDLNFGRIKLKICKCFFARYQAKYSTETQKPKREGEHNLGHKHIQLEVAFKGRPAQPFQVCSLDMF